MQEDRYNQNPSEDLANVVAAEKEVLRGEPADAAGY